ncbi:hypothetical protein [Variovorax sp. KK3]|uniref:hypothetical protein n=1 Tax=Variovorax sp. KK3 TaxID=1855728 RepID=UPI00097C7734|nr:hypothetical protein [Variovorax sp. KK3]
MEQALTASTERFDAQVLDMTRARQASASLASAATLVDIRTFGWKALERYVDESAVLLDSGPAAALRFTDAEVVQVLDAATDHLSAVYASAATCMRETARAIGMHPVPAGLEEELFTRLVHCGGRLACAVSARRAGQVTTASPGALEWLRAAGRRLARRLSLLRRF